MSSIIQLATQAFSRGITVSREQVEAHQASWALGLEIAWCHFHYILLVKISHKANVDTKGRKLQNHIKRDMKTGEWFFLETKTNHFCKQPTYLVIVPMPQLYVSCASGDHLCTQEPHEYLCLRCPHVATVPNTVCISCCMLTDASAFLGNCPQLKGVALS